MFSNDQPITRPGEDLFRRKGFALTLAQSVSDASYAKNGFVFAITGDWGTGKSSVLRLIERFLLHIDIRKRTARPLWWQDAAVKKTIDEIEEMALLFERVAPAIDKLKESDHYLINASIEFQRLTCRANVETDEDAEKALCYWHYKESVIADPEIIVVHFSPWLIAGKSELAAALLSELGRGLGAVLGDPVRDAFAKLLTRISELAPVVGIGANFAHPGMGQAFNAAGSASSVAAKRLTTGPTLEAIRSQLGEILRKLNDKKILVIVDDIDRLTPHEAAQSISLIKSLGDLPNVMYLLSYDRRIVRKQLKKALKVDGHEYLEKIVQYEVELPPIENIDLLKVVDANISSIFARTVLNQKRLSELWNDVLKHYIKSPRDVRRYFNPLAMAQSGLAEFTDPIDLMGLQALHVFEPDLYRFVRDNIEQFVGSSRI